MHEEANQARSPDEVEEEDYHAFEGGEFIMESND